MRALTTHEAWLLLARAFDARANGTAPVVVRPHHDFFSGDLAQDGICRATRLLSAAGGITEKQESDMDQQAHRAVRDSDNCLPRSGMSLRWWKLDAEGAGARAIFCALMAEIEWRDQP